MQEKISEWNGIAVHGEVSELDRMIHVQGLINIDKNDLVRSLSRNGENYVVTACSDSTSQAFNEALSSLPKPVTDLKSLIMEVRYGSRQLLVSDIAGMIGTEVCKSVDSQLTLLWSVAEEAAVGDKFKIVLIASY